MVSFSKTIRAQQIISESISTSGGTVTGGGGGSGTDISDSFELYNHPADDSFELIKLKAVLDGEKVTIDAVVKWVFAGANSKDHQEFPSGGSTDNIPGGVGCVLFKISDEYIPSSEVYINNGSQNFIPIGDDKKMGVDESFAGSGTATIFRDDNTSDWKYIGTRTTVVNNEILEVKCSYLI